MTRLALLEILKDEVGDLDRLARHLPIESFTELQPHDACICETVRQRIDQLWRLVHEAIVAADLASIKIHRVKGKNMPLNLQNDFIPHIRWLALRWDGKK